MPSPSGLPRSLWPARLAALLLAMAFAAVPAAQAQIFVDADASGADDGTSWGNAFTNLQDALNIATESDEIWIAEGTYTPTSGTDRSVSFQVGGGQDGLGIFGGFAGGETDRSQRDPAEHPVVLSGDIGTPGEKSDNSLHVLFFDASGSDNLTGDTVLDGVTVRGGNADGSFPDNSGGGLFCDGDGSGNTCSPMIANVTFSDNTAAFGGAIFNDGRSSGTSNPQFVNVVFSDNTAGSSGGAVYNDGDSGGTSSPQIRNCVFADNEATSGAGGAMFNEGIGGTSSPQIVSTTFTDNTAGNEGGALFNDGGSGGTSTPTIDNTILHGNSATLDGDEIFNDAATPTVSHTLIEGGVNGSGVGGDMNNDDGNNVGADPLFVDAGDPDGADDTFTTLDDGLRPMPGSPAVDAGDNGALPADAADLDEDGNTSESHPLDLLGAQRTRDGTVDLGAYERDPDPPATLFVDADATGANDGTSWGDAFPDLQTALVTASSNSEIWIAEGTYTPTGGTDRSVSFKITGGQDGLGIFGGFASGETSRSQRDPGANPVVFSGDIGTPNDASDNSYHVLFFDGTGRGNVTRVTVLDGVIVTGGNADDSEAPHDRGGGLFCDGSGSGNECSPTMTNVVFIGNSVLRFGGAIYNDGRSSGTGSPQIANVVFADNSGGFGGAVFNDGDGGVSSPTIVNTTFFDNSVTDTGGALGNSGPNGGTSTPTITNVILWGNSADLSGDEINNLSATPTLSHTLIEGGVNGSGVSGDPNNDGGGNLNANPAFANTLNPDGTDGNFASDDDGSHLRTGSPALDAGDGNALPDDDADLDGDGNTTEPLPLDLTGATRVQNGTVDLGAYEGGVPDPVLTLRVDADAAGANDGSSWADAITDLRVALLGATGNDEIWIAEGTYKPTSGTDRTVSFDVTGTQDGLNIFGGFESGDSFGDRNPDDHSVVLSGDIGATGDNSDNSYHVLFFDGTTGGPLTASTLLDGVTVTKGRATSGPNDSNPENSGAGLFCDGAGTGNECSPTIDNVTFSNNGANTFGGAIFANGDGGTSSPTIRDATFTINSAEFGGAIFNEGRNGGASNPTMTNASFGFNSANTSGGAIFNAGTDGASNPTIGNTTFNLNSAETGGAIYSDGRSGGEANATILQSTFESNTASSSGGALYNEGSGGTSSPTLASVTFSDNSADSDGGAIFNDGNDSGTSSPTIANGVFVRNEAGSNGGAVFNFGDNGGTSTPTIVNSTFTLNMSTSAGGAIANDGTGGTSTPALSNSILWGNEAGSGGDEVHNLNAASTLNHTLIEGGVNGSGVSGDPNTDDGGNLDTNPLLLNARDADGPDDTLRNTDDGLRHTTGSPALDAGDNGLLPSDDADLDEDDDTAEQIPLDVIDGTRVQNGTVDLGAYEGGVTDPAETIYVDADADGADDGSSWTDAFTDLNDALLRATRNDEVWIAEGTYRPTTGFDRSVRFEVTSATDGLEIFGGFASGDSFADRDPEDHPVVLSGDVGATGDASDNSYHVLFFDGSVGGTLTTATVLDGVTIRGGNADGSFPDNSGGGLFCDGDGADHVCSPTIVNATFASNIADFGGAVFNDGRSSGTSNPQFVNVVFSDNTATTSGGAIYSDGDSGGTSSPQITNSLFADNEAASGEGGAMFNEGNGGTSSPQIVSVTFTGNTAGSDGGAMFSDGGSGGTSTPTIDNTILHGNSAAGSGAEIFNDDGATPTVSHTLIEGGVNGSGVGGDPNNNGGNNVDADPQFVAPGDPDGADNTFATDDDGLRFLSGSPVIGAGDEDALPSDAADLDGDGNTTEPIPHDLTGAARIQDGTVDLGSYEGGIASTLTVDGTAGADGTDAGWRFLGVPTVSSVNAGDLRLGGTTPDFDLPSGHMLQEWDDTQGSGSPSGGYDPIESSSETLTPGRGYAVFLFDQNPYPIDPSMTISLAGSPALRGNETVTISGLAETAQWHLLGNPYPGGYDLSSFTDLTANGFQAQVQRYDATTDTWVVEDQSTTDLAAWQGFFIERSDPGGANPGATSVVFDPAGRIRSAPFIGSMTSKPSPQRAALGLALVVTSPEGDTLGRDAAAQVLFNKQATRAWDPWDASKLRPLAAQYALAAPVGRGRGDSLVSKAVESQPWPSERQEVPLRLRTEGLNGVGEATLSVRRWELPDGWRARIVDTQTGHKQVLDPSSNYGMTLPADTEEVSSRYELQVAPEGTPLSVELAAFEAGRSEEGIRLTWQTASESNNAVFHVQRRGGQASGGRSQLWETIGRVEGAGTTVEPQSYRFTDADLPFTADTLAYRLKQIDTDGSAHLSVPVTVARGAVQEVQLHSSFPNPARTQTTIRYALPRSQDVHLAVYDLLGRQVQTLVHGRQEAGRKQVRFDISRLSAGTYFYRLTAGGVAKIQKLTVIR